MGEEEGEKRKEKVTKGGKMVLVKLVEQLLQCMVDFHPSVCLRTQDLVITAQSFYGWNL